MKKLNLKSLTDKLIPVAEMSVGFAAAKAIPALVGKIYKPANGGLSNTIVGISELAAGVFLSTMKNKHLANIGLGIAVSGAHTFLAKPINQGLEAAGIAINGLHAPGASYSYNYNPNYSRMAGNEAVGCGERNVLN